MKIEISPEDLGAVIELLDDLQRRLELDAVAYASMIKDSVEARKLAFERVQRAAETRILVDKLVNI
ncbi:hypothetical protein KQI82_01900 [Oscillibacter sp. MSJ-2]|uniref:Uncharacterized protein n=1 Tax=Dysosmobacter acutus TaxID=2841504 RepID=A0ABS6F5X2_9FIRM|nr:hypothetical protein [Dysosmobacter acutus]MBU5625688.1 hypothetical protein [Dysosmobacter acutus]